jgi:hypothetical protein
MTKQRSSRRLPAPRSLTRGQSEPDARCKQPSFQHTNPNRSQMEPRPRTAHSSYLAHGNITHLAHAASACLSVENRSYPTYAEHHAPHARSQCIPQRQKQPVSHRRRNLRISSRPHSLDLMTAPPPVRARLCRARERGSERIRHTTAKTTPPSHNPTPPQTSSTPFATT